MAAGTQIISGTMPVLGVAMTDLTCHGLTNRASLASLARWTRRAGSELDLCLLVRGGQAQRGGPTGQSNFERVIDARRAEHAPDH